MPTRTPANWVQVVVSRLGIVRRGSAPPDPGDIVTPDERHNSKLLTLEAPMTSLALGGVVNFFALFAMQLGASNSVVGWLTAGPALISLLWLVPSGRLIQRSRSYAHSLAVAAFSHRVLLIALVLVPFLPSQWRPWGVVVLVSVASMPATMWGLAFQAACGEMFDPRHMSRLIGRRWASANIANVIGTLALGKLIDVLPSPLSFQVLFAGVGLITLFTVWMILRLRLPPRDLLEEGPAAAGEATADRSLLSQLRRHRSFILYEVGILVGYLALYAAMPLYRIYWVRDLGAAGAWIGILTAALSIGATAGSLLWGRWSRPGRDRRNGLVAGLGAMALYPLLTGTFSTLAPQIFVVALAGFFVGGSDLILFNRTVQVSPRKRRPTFLAIHSIVVSTAGFAGPLVSAALADSLGTRAVLFGVAALGLIGALLIYLLGWGEAKS